ncbi:hypothetical protein [Clostridium akagii]|uniref:hypothetical protein n=1 Tax=Clostridium akagii TaxID=91623 RepID=UPI00047BB5F5|nr:hypothetical protein [Clostridium akagii]
MLNKYKFLPTKEQSITRIIVSIFFMVLGVFCVILFNKAVGIIIILTSSCIICLYLYYLIFMNKGLSSIEVKIIIEKQKSSC